MGAVVVAFDIQFFLEETVVPWSRGGREGDERLKKHEDF